VSGGGLVKVVSKFASDNAPAILAGTAVAGVVGTAVAVGKGTWQAAEDIRTAELIKGDPISGIYTMPTKERVQLVWKRYIPAAAVAGTTVVCIIAGATVSGRRNAALIAAYSVSESMFSEYKDKVIEQFGEGKETKVRDAIAQDHVNQNPASNQVAILGDGEVLCYEAITGRYFRSTVQTIRNAENRINYQINNDMYATQNEFFELIGLPATGMGETLGWNNGTPLEVQISSILTEDEKPALHVGYRRLPVPNYTNLH